MNNEWMDESEFGPDYVILSLEDGDIKCSVMGIFSAENGKEYIAFFPEENNTTGEVILYRYIEHEGEGFTLENIDDDAEYEMVEIAFGEWLYEMEYSI